MFKFLVRQIFEKDPQQPNASPSTSLVEIGPRFVLTPIRIFEGAFGGVTVYSNPGSLLYPGVKMANSDRNTNVGRIHHTNGDKEVGQAKQGGQIWQAKGC